MVSSANHDEINLGVKNFSPSVILSLTSLVMLIMVNFDLIVSSLAHL